MPTKQRYMSNAANERERGRTKSDIASEEEYAKKARFMRGGLYKFAVGSSVTDKVYEEQEKESLAKAKELKTGYKKRWGHLASEKGSTIRKGK